MTYLEKFNNEVEFAKYKANKYLEMIEKDGYLYYADRFCKHINLLTYPEINMTEQEKIVKAKDLANIEFLKNVIDGKEMSQIYLMEWEFMKNNEWPEWRN